MSEVKMTRTPRGFALCEFMDRYKSVCSIQKSSLATEDAIWFGVNDANPIMMVPGKPGWHAVDVDALAGGKVQFTTRMHLTQDHVRALLPLLQHFAETGELPEVSP